MEDEASGGDVRVSKLTVKIAGALFAAALTLVVGLLSWGASNINAQTLAISELKGIATANGAAAAAQKNEIDRLSAKLDGRTEWGFRIGAAEKEIVEVQTMLRELRDRVDQRTVDRMTRSAFISWIGDSRRAGYPDLPDPR